VSDRVKRKPKVRPRASGKAIDAESPPHWTWKFLASPIDAGIPSPPLGTSGNPFPGHIADLGSRIESDTQLGKDFAFFIRKTAWSREDFLWHLFWDADVMHIDDPMRFRKIKEGTWPIRRETVETVLKNLSKLAKEIERINATDFSPARMGILCNGTGERLPPKDEQYLLKAFCYLPAILAFYRQELNIKFRIADEDWTSHVKSRRSIFDLTKRDSLYEKIRKKTDRYHTDRLYRLLSVAREIRRLPPIKPRAFVIWLNRLKKAQNRLAPQSRANHKIASPGRGPSRIPR